MLLVLSHFRITFTVYTVCAAIPSRAGRKVCISYRTRLRILFLFGVTEATYNKRNYVFPGKEVTIDWLGEAAVICSKAGNNILKAGKG